MLQHPLRVLDLVDHLTARVRGRVRREDRVGVGGTIELTQDAPLEVKVLSDGLDHEPRAACRVGHRPDEFDLSRSRRGKAEPLARVLDVLVDELLGGLGALGRAVEDANWTAAGCEHQRDTRSERARADDQDWALIDVGRQADGHRRVSLRALVLHARSERRGRYRCCHRARRPKAVPRFVTREQRPAAAYPTLCHQTSARGISRSPRPVTRTWPGT